MQKAIDIHCHFNQSICFGNTETINERYNFDFIKKEREKLNIPIIAMAGTYEAVLTDKDVVNQNAYLYDVANAENNIFQWVVVDPRVEESFFQAKRFLINKKCLGIKIHPTSHGYRLRDYSDKIFAFANENSCVVLMHPENMNDTLNIANEYSNSKIIVAHLGTNEEYVRIINDAKHQNIYTDTSGMASRYNFVVENTVKEVSSEKVLFGTDCYSCAFQRGRIDYADISEEDKNNILFKNALKLFPQIEKNL